MTAPDRAARRHAPTAVFRVVAMVETVSFLVLLAVTLVHRAFDGPDLVYVPGLVHGIVFLVYAALALKVKPAQGWNLVRLVVVVILAAVPLGGLWVERRYVTEPAAEALA